MDGATDGWPPKLREIAAAVGAARALQLAREVGGTEVYLAASPTERNRLVELLGEGAYRRLVAALGPGTLQVPLGPTAGSRRQQDQIREMLDAGLSVNEVARRLHVHARTVRRCKWRDLRQLELI